MTMPKEASSAHFMKSAFVAAALLIMVATPSVAAHSPLSSGDNTRLASAAVIPDVAKSWAIYSALEGEMARYYSFNASEGERIYATLFISPQSKESGFLPYLAIMGPWTGGGCSLPSYIETPDGYGCMILKGEIAEDAYYEGFSPSAFYNVARLDINAPEGGEYCLAVFALPEGVNGSARGNFGLAVGYKEEFTLAEWAYLPINLLAIYQWGGQSPLESAALIFAVPALILSVAMIRRPWRKIFSTPPSALMAIAGAACLGTASNLLYQISYCLRWAPLGAEVGITLTFLLIQAIIGVYLLRAAYLHPIPSLKVRAASAALGIIAFALYAGFYIAPASAIIASIAPSRRRKDNGAAAGI